MSKILITGGSGFIGRHVAYNLMDNGHVPIIFDRKLDRWKENPSGSEQFFGDVRDFTSINEAVAISDGVIHLAGVLGTSETINEPRPSVETNILGSINVFQACRNYDKKCSYISVGNYWMNNSYSITKDTAERFAWMFNRELGTKIAVSRALNAYGPFQKAEPVRKIIPNFIIPALKGEEIIVYGDGSQVMDMVFVSDVAECLVRALTVEHGQYVFNPIQEKDRAPKFEIGTGRETTVQEIAELVISMVGKGGIKNVPMRKGEPESSVVLGNPETLRPLFEGELPEFISLEEGLEETIEFYDMQLIFGDIK